MTDHARPFNISSARFPGGSLLAAYFHRDVVRLSDRGGASGMIGDRWAAIVSDEVSRWPGQPRPLPNGTIVTIERVVRLDDIPAIARVASKRKLQNPDFMAFATDPAGHSIIVGIDSKFSVETAKAAQVSAQTTQALLDVGARITDYLAPIPPDVAPQDGLFVSPDDALSHYMFSRQRGLHAVSAPHEQFVMLPISPDDFLQALEGREWVATLARLDTIGDELPSNLLANLYEFRLARAIIGCWLDYSSPLLGHKDHRPPDLARISEISRRIIPTASSSWDLVLRWDELADRTRRRRDAVHHATALPIVNRDLRQQLDATVASRGVVAPSLNAVRKRLAAWYLGEIQEEIGQVPADVADFPAVLAQLGQTVTRLASAIPDASARAIDAAIEDAANRPPDDD